MKLRIVLYYVSVCLGGLCSASCYGWINQIFNHLVGPDSEIPLTSEQAAWIISFINVGTMITTFPGGFLINYIGRKSMILLTGPLYIVTWLAILYFPSVYVLGLARLLQGCGIGLVSTVAPVYLGEIADKSSRGAITSIYFNSWWFAYVLVFTLGAIFPFFSYTLITLALNIPFIILLSYQPESPYYFMMIGEEDKARKSLQWFRNTSDDAIDKELSEIKENINTSSTSIRDVIATPGDRKALALIVALSLICEMSGQGTLGVYATHIFSRTPGISISPNVVTVILGVVMLLGGFVGSLTSDKVGRRPLVLTSSIGSVICQLTTGTFYFLLFKTSVDVSRFSWLAPVSIFIYAGILTAGMYAVCATYISELFETQTRGVASSVSTINITLGGFASMLMFQPLTYNFGLYAVFYVHAFCSFLGALFFYFTAPETKGKSFVQIRNDVCKAR